MMDYVKMAHEALTAANCATRESPHQLDLSRACAVLNRAGSRIVVLETGTTIGVWSDLDGPEVRTALRTLGLDQLPVRYLDGAGVPMRYKLRRVKGDPVSMSVLARMEQHPNEPWKVRDSIHGQESGQRRECGQGTEPATVSAPSSSISTQNSLLFS